MKEGPSGFLPAGDEDPIRASGLATTESWDSGTSGGGRQAPGGPGRRVGSSLLLSSSRSHRPGLRGGRETVDLSQNCPVPGEVSEGGRRRVLRVLEGLEEVLSLGVWFVRLVFVYRRLPSLFSSSFSSLPSFISWVLFLQLAPSLEELRGLGCSGHHATLILPPGLRLTQVTWPSLFASAATAAVRPLLCFFLETCPPPANKADRAGAKGVLRLVFSRPAGQSNSSLEAKEAASRSPRGCHEAALQSKSLSYCKVAMHLSPKPS